MKRLFKFLVLAAILGGVAVVVVNAMRRRATAPVHTTPWEAPTVAGPEADVAERVRDSAEEGMTPAPEEAPVDIAKGSGGEAIVSELAAPGAAEALLAEAEEDECLEIALDRATKEGMTAPPDSPPIDVAFDSEGDKLLSEFAPPGAPEALFAAIEEEAGLAFDPDAEITSELAGSDAETAALDAEAALLEALAESEAQDDASADFFASLEGGLTAEESPLDMGLHEMPSIETEIESSLELLLDEAEAEGRATEEQVEHRDDAIEEADVLTRAFDELASTPPASAPIEAEPEVRADEHLLSSVEEALGDLEPAPIVPPPRRTAESYLDEGNVYFNVGQYGLAIERYGQAIELDDTLTAAFYNRANAHTRAGEFDKALSDYDRALALQPADADALNNRGMLHLYRSNYTNALSDFNKALDVDPSDTTVMVNRGLAQLHSGNAAAALVDFREAANMDQGDAAAQYGAAQAAASLGNKDEALRHVARALELDASYAREAAGDPRLQALQGDEEFLRLLRQSGSRSG